MKSGCIHIIVGTAAVLAIFSNELLAQDVVFKGQAIGWAVTSRMEEINGMGSTDKVWRGQAGLRYIPELQFNVPVKEKYTFEAKASANFWGSGLYWSADSTIWDGDVSPYRAWMKISGDQFEIRGGLQKINFGSASMLRPLMWFDQIDPRDPLQLTDGVWAVLGRYYFLNNANIWLWGLYGNDKTKGWESVPSVRYKPEFGFRVQVPVPGGELATTYHYRVADLGKVMAIPPGAKEHIREKRLAMDGKFDYMVGLWFEATMTHQEIHIPEMKYQRALSVGLDYTFGLGNGLNMMTETFTFGISDRPVAGGEEFWFSALSANYSLNIFTGVNAIVFYDWTNKEVYNFINWSWQFDRWSFYVMGFWNPQNFEIYRSLEGANLYAGKGLQFMAVFNH